MNLVGLIWAFCVFILFFDTGFLALTVLEPDL